jgi:hypothetical protein
VAIEMTTWQERRQRGNSDVIGQYGKKKKIGLYFSTVWPILSITSQIERRKFLQYVLVNYFHRDQGEA